MYFREGRPRLLYGTQGADGQPQTLAAVLTRLIDYQMDPLNALTRPRFLLGKTYSDSRDSLRLQPHRKRSKLSDDTFTSPTDTYVNGNGAISMNGHASHGEVDGSLVIVDIPVRERKPSAKRGQKIDGTLYLVSAFSVMDEFIC